MDKIAEEAHVTKQTVYRYFESKESLFRAALEAQRLEGSNDFLKALAIEDPTQALETFAVGFIERHLSEEHLANIRLLVSEGPKVPEITRAFYAMGPRRTKIHLARFFKDRFNFGKNRFTAGSEHSAGKNSANSERNRRYQHSGTFGTA
jgi:AcrR family transcriptional regulator